MVSKLTHVTTFTDVVGASGLTQPSDVTQWPTASRVGPGSAVSDRTDREMTCSAPTTSTFDSSRETRRIVVENTSPQCCKQSEDLEEFVGDPLCFPIFSTGDSVFPFINVRIMKHLLSGYDHVKAAYLINGFSNGFSLGCVFPPAGDCESNLKSCELAPEVLDGYIADELKMGRLIGPFRRSPFQRTKISPIGLVPKSSAGEFRVIHHLSYPLGESVNDCIPRECVRVSYGPLMKLWRA